MAGSPWGTGCLGCGVPGLPQATTAIALHYMAKGEDDTAKKVLEEAIPFCAENNGKTLMQGLLFVPYPKSGFDPEVSREFN